MHVDREWRIRIAAFHWLTDIGAQLGEVTRSTLERGFNQDGVRIPLVGPQGIWSPAGFRVPMSITTVPGQYADSADDPKSGFRYSYRGTDPNHRDNTGLRRAKAERTPLIYFFRTDPGYYLAQYPVYVVADDPTSLMFSVKADEAWVVDIPVPDIEVQPETPLRRDYATRLVRQRLFQAEFRRRVVAAYRGRCALCRLRHRELLDAAHITPDASISGDPVVSNGMSLCKLHHAAFDQFFFTVTPDFRVVVRPSILAESDGPMLVVGLQQIHDSVIEIPSHVSHRPDPDRLERRYAEFLLKAAG